MQQPDRQLPAQTVQRIQEAASSWMMLWQIWNRFGPSPDGAVERDMSSAGERLRSAIADLER